MPQTKVRKAYTYGIQGKKKGDSVPWNGGLSLSDDHKRSRQDIKIPRRKGIWSKVSVSPFKKSPLKKTVGLIDMQSSDPFGFQVDDPYLFEEDNFRGTQKVHIKDKDKSPRKASASLKMTTPVKDGMKSSEKTLVSPKSPKSPTGMSSRLLGKILPQERVTISVQDLQSYGNVKKKSEHNGNTNNSKLVDKSEENIVKRDIFAEKKTAPKLKVNNRRKKTVATVDKIVMDENKNLDEVDTVRSQLKNTVSKVKTYSKRPRTVARLSDKTLSKNVGEDIDDPFSMENMDSNLEVKLDSNLVKRKTQAQRSNTKSTEQTASDKEIETLVENEVVTTSQESQTKKGASVSKSKTKTKSLFAYYDRQKKIYGESKKNNVITEESDSELPDYLSDSCETVTNNDASVLNPTKRSLLKSSEDTQTAKKQKLNHEISSQEPSCSSSSLQNSDIEKNGSVNESKKVKSPFKSLKMRRHRRFSSLPTSYTSQDSSGEENGENDDIGDGDEKEDAPPALYRSTIFGFSRAASAVRVKKDEKELFTVVKNTKHAHECLEHGESQQFKDDLEYLLDGLKSTQNMSTRCLSALELASKSVSPAFRMHMKAHGVIQTIFTILQDGLTDERLVLCTATIMYVISKDRLKIDFNKKIVEFMLKLLSRKQVKPTRGKEYERLQKKVRVILEKQGILDIDLDSVDAMVLARETLLSLTSQRMGEWFKEEIRTLGGLDHIVDTIYLCSKCIQKKTELNKTFRQMERCLLLLCDMTFQNSKNQKYLDSYRDTILIESCIRTLSLVTSKIDLENDLTTELQDCLFATLRMLTNLSHENEPGSLKICKQEAALNSILKCTLHLPQFFPDKTTFDFIVVSLGLLINLVEHSKHNTKELNTAFAPACYESQSSSEQDLFTPVESLMQLFLVRFEACKEGDLMEELDKLENEQDEREAAMHYHDDEYALTCGDKFEDTVEESGEHEPEDENNDIEISGNNPIALNQKEKQDIKSTLEKAHQHMEDSHVAAYTALLIGLLVEDNKDNQETVHSLLPEGDFTPMQESLEKILAFMKMTGATNESGFKVIERIIELFKSCRKNDADKSEH